ncbi:MAG: hypothetical protein IKD21_02535 [Clostridia bacterium]|nr:hypothetical protein [Clostridia bacterium]
MFHEKTKYSLVCLIFFLLMPVCVSANMVWPSLYIAEGMRSWYVILIGLVIEIIFVKGFLKQSYLKSVLIAFVMNLASTVLGIIAIPLSGFIGEILMIPFDTGTFHPTHWLMSYIFAILSNVLIEGFTVKFIFKHNFKKMFWWLFVANAISVIVCILFHGIVMQNINI